MPTSHWPKRGATCLLLASVFVPQVVSGLYQGLGRPVPAGYSLLTGLALWLSMVAWFSQYSQEHHVPWVVDMGWFLYLVWIVVAPYYIVQREGRAGLGRIALFCGAWAAAWTVGRATMIWVRVLVTQ